MLRCVLRRSLLGAEIVAIAEHLGDARTTLYIELLHAWIMPSVDFHASASISLLDRLTLVMLLVVTGVGLLIHIYAVGYMAHEGGYYRFFAYLNLFMFFMLMLVLAANFLLMFVGWEGVGLCSLPADRLLLQEELGRRRRQEGLHRQPHRRLRLLCWRCS